MCMCAGREIPYKGDKELDMAAIPREPLAQWNEEAAMSPPWEDTAIVLALARRERRISVRSSHPSF